MSLKLLLKHKKRNPKKNTFKIVKQKYLKRAAMHRILHITSYLYRIYRLGVTENQLMTKPT